MISTIIINRNYYDYEEALKHMLSQDVNHIGWLNSGIKLPKGNYEKVYSNRSGSSCLYYDIVKRIAYSVDMGN